VNRTPLRKPPAPQLDLFAGKQSLVTKEDVAPCRVFIDPEFPGREALAAAAVVPKPTRNWGDAFEHVRQARYEPERPALFKLHSFDFVEEPEPMHADCDNRGGACSDCRAGWDGMQALKPLSIPGLVGMLAAGGNAMCEACIARLRLPGEYSPRELHAGKGGGFVVMLFKQTGDVPFENYSCMSCGHLFTAACPAKKSA
jgi:hypothetical protein